MNAGRPLAFSKMEALGNDFMVVDARIRSFAPDPNEIRRLADRRLGVGFDQLLVIDPAPRTGLHCALRIFNADGSSAEQCGNGLRAVALWLARNEPGFRSGSIQTAGGEVLVAIDTEGRISASLSCPDFEPAAWGGDKLPEHWTSELCGQVVQPVGVSMGNPHLVVDWPRSPTELELREAGELLGQHPGLARGANVGLAHVQDRRHIRLAVFERGAGPTPACGSGACAAAAVLQRAGLVDLPVQVEQPGGALVIDWIPPDSAMTLSGPARHIYDACMERDPAA